TQGGVLNAGPPAAIAGCLPAWVSSSSFTLGSGALDILGKPYVIPSTLTKSGLSGFSASVWLYLKAAAPASGNELSAGEISLDATSPSWSDTYKAWYIGSDRVIDVLRSDGSGNLAETRNNGRVVFASPSAFLSTSSPATSDTALSVGLPPLGSLLFYGSIYVSLSNAQAYQVFMSCYSATSGNGDLIHEGYAPASYGRPFTKMASASQQVTYKTVWNGNGSLALYLHGFALPAGMRR
ncbi:MAG: hypothetical protein ABIK12_14135, partial [Pseudomonadota bacterium]